MKREFLGELLANPPPPKKNPYGSLEITSVLSDYNSQYIQNGMNFMAMYEVNCQFNMQISFYSLKTTMF